MVSKVSVEFTWHSGFAKSQKQKSIASLHDHAKLTGLFPLLEISTKSNNPIGVSLSAFNLMVTIHGYPRRPVECYFQSSKVFQHGGPYRDLINQMPKAAKRDPRLRNSGELNGFRLHTEWGLEPQTAFYDWLYINALLQNRQLSSTLENYRGFTDIEFNPDKSINCQAHSAALFIALKRERLLSEAIESKLSFLRVVYSEPPSQPNLI